MPILRVTPLRDIPTASAQNPLGPFGQGCQPGDWQVTLAPGRPRRWRSGAGAERTELPPRRRRARGKGARYPADAGRGSSTQQSNPALASQPRLTPETVRRTLEPFVSAARKTRIDHVLDQRLASVTVVLENLYDPHNGAAVLRTCEALGLAHVHVVEGGEAFFFSHKVSKSANKWLNVYLHRSSSSCLAYLACHGFARWAAVAPPPGHSPVQWPVVDVSEPVALVFGNEHAGLSGEARAACDRSFTIPMFGFTESLNLSVSVAMALHPTVTQRRQFLGKKGDLGSAGRQRLQAAYYALSTRHAPQLLWHALQQETR